MMTNSGTRCLSESAADVTEALRRGPRSPGLPAQLTKTIDERERQPALDAAFRDRAFGSAAPQAAVGRIDVEQPVLSEEFRGTEAQSPRVGTAMDVEDRVARGQRLSLAHAVHLLQIAVICPGNRGAEEHDESLRAAGEWHVGLEVADRPVRAADDLADVRLHHHRKSLRQHV